MDKKKIEQQSLTMSAIVNLISGLMGLAVFIITDLNALLLDAVFTLIAFVSTLIALFISKNSHRTTAAFPQGLYFLEPLYGIVKSLAVLMLLFITFLETTSTAFRYFFEHQGLPMTTDFVLPYTLLTSTMCFALAFYNQHKSKELNHMSTIVQAESKGNWIDGLISLGIGVAMLILYFIPITSPLGFLHYTGDFFITVLLILFFIKEPLQILVVSFKELTHSTFQDEALETHIRSFLTTHLPEQLSKMDIFIYKQGMQLTVRMKPIYKEVAGVNISTLNEVRKQLHQELIVTYPYLTIEYIF